MERGAAQRATGATKLNAMSSRSHAVFIIIVEKSTVMAEDSLAAEDEEMEQFRGLAPGDSLSKSMPQQSSLFCPRVADIDMQKTPKKHAVFEDGLPECWKLTEYWIWLLLPLCAINRTNCITASILSAE